MSCFVRSNPFDLVKTRMQVPAALSEYTGMGQAMRMIVRREGFGTFYKGVGASVTRDMLGSSVNLTVASMASEALAANGWLAPGSPALGAVSGILSAAAAVAVMQPIDTSRAYVYLKPHLHKDVLHAARFIVLREGPMALYRGSRAHFFRTAPHYALMFALLEGITGVERALIVRRNAETLARVPVFANLSATQRDVLARGVSVVKYARGDVIVREGDVDDDNEMFFVLRGTARSVRGGGDELDAFVESVKEASPTRRRRPRTPRPRPRPRRRPRRAGRGPEARLGSTTPCRRPRGREPRRWRRTVGRRALPALTLAPATTLASRRCWWTSRGRRPWWPRACPRRASW